MEKKRILYVGDVGQTFSAKYVHACGICDLFQRAGYDVKVVCDGHSSTEEIKEISGVEFSYTKQYITKTRLKSVENIIEWSYGPKLWRLFKKRAKVYRPDYVVLYGNSIERPLIKYCRQHSIPLIVERADWFEKNDYTTLIEKIFFYPHTQKAITKLDRYASGVIAISSFFKQYYETMGVNVVRIPPLFKDKLVLRPENRTNEDNLHLVYAGSLGGNKDSILPVVKVVHRLNQGKNRILLSLVGLSEATVSVASGIHELNKSGIKCYGRVSHDVANSIVTTADFSFLLRENKRYAKAGFSTKFAESMMCGVPVICTQVGGADDILKDGYDGFLLKDNSEQTIESVIKHLLDMSSDDILTIKQNAYATGVKMFLSQNYVSKIQKFFEKSCNIEC